ncbi:MAG: type III PLP-dependent enzyme [Hyphomicrobiaceae bacterium]
MSGEQRHAREASGALAARLVGEHFGVARGCLHIGGMAAGDLVATYGSPLYVYDGDLIEARFDALQAALNGFAKVYYSIKANPNPAIAALIVARGGGLEVASGAEYKLARAAGANADSILFAGPGKGEQELELAIADGIGEIHLESFEEIAHVAAIARRHGRVANVAIRINPGAGAQGGAMRMGGKPAAFGFDEEVLETVVAAVAAEPGLRLSGVHLFAGTQILDADVLLRQWEYGLRLAADVARLSGGRIARIDLGGGLGIPYHDGDKSLDLARIAAGAQDLQRRRQADPLLRSAEVLIEPGRYLVGPAGVYLMSVRAVKMSRGQRFIVTDGGMHHHLAASGNLGQVIKRDYPLVAATRLADGGRSAASLVGPLCTPLDTLGRQTELADVAEGDIVAVLQSGAYGLSASPVGFLSHPMPAEVLIRGGTHRCIRPRGTFDAPLVNLSASPQF